MREPTLEEIKACCGKLLKECTMEKSCGFWSLSKLGKERV
jgi:hypothetical protein